MNYNPFKKDITEIELIDIQSLLDNEISEGWYIEYKSQIPSTGKKLDNLKISKSISSFANTKGGWIIWGIECLDNKPSKIVGIDISSFRNFEDQVSQLINENINPRPYYHSKTINIDDDKVIFIIYVEESPTPPYITSQGIIYQRENNESKPIRDRYILEKLNEKTESYHDAIERFTNFDLPETKGQGDWNQTYLELYLFPLPFDNFSFKKFYSSDFFKDVASRFYQGVSMTFKFEKEYNVPNLNLGFNSVYSSESSLIIRPLNEQNLIYKSTTVELFENGNLKFLLPIFEFTQSNIPNQYVGSNTIEYILDKFSPYEDGYEYDDYNISPGRKTRDRKESDFSNIIKFIDGHEILLTTILITKIYKAILEDNNYDFENRIGFRAKITDCWRKFIFFDNDDYLEKLKIYNIPLSPKDQIEIPEFKKGRAYTINLSDDYSFLTVARFIMEGIGLPDSETIKYSEILEKSIQKFNS